MIFYSSGIQHYSRYAWKDPSFEEVEYLTSTDPLQTHQLQVRMSSYWQPGRKNIEKPDTYISENKFWYHLVNFLLLFSNLVI